jgi:hypothetical protein
MRGGDGGKTRVRERVLLQIAVWRFLYIHIIVLKINICVCIFCYLAGGLWWRKSILLYFCICVFTVIVKTKITVSPRMYPHCL